MTNSDTDVLIVGSGPTGLVLALALTTLGVRVHIVDTAAGPGTTSRALGVQARTLEFYDQLGIAQDVVARGRRIEGINLWVAGKNVAHAIFGEIGAGISPYSFVLIFPQDEHEQLLIDRLADRGVHVARQTELVGFEQSASSVTAHLKHKDGSVRTIDAAYIAGCDGAHSAVRHALGIGFEGGTYEHLFYVADVTGGGEVMNGELHVALDTTDFLAVFPLKDRGRARLVGTVRDHVQARSDLSWDDVSKRVLDWMRLLVQHVNWFSTYHVHHRVATRFQSGRAFLVGDAGHVHSPVGAQGMNTGIGDAINLAWKLANVIQGRAGAALLDTYEPERIAFARRLVATTDKAFTAVSDPSAQARFVRLTVVPLILPLVFGFAESRRFMFRTVSQTAIHYRHSTLSEGRAGDVHGGDRLPWVSTAQLGMHEDNFRPLCSMDWQVHVYGEPSPALQAACNTRGLALHAFPWCEQMSQAGLQRDASYLVRPDGYVALADARADAASLDAYLKSRELKMEARG